MEKLLLIDGHSILNRAYFALPPMTASDGRHTNAVVGFLNIMMKFLDDEKPEYLTVAFDVHAPTFRHKMYAEYKGTRKKMDDELREQVPLIQEMLTKMGIPIVKKEGLEADDVLGTLGTKAAAEGLMVTIVSGDRDLLQLASDNIKIAIPKTKRTGTEVEEYFKADVIEKMGVTPTQFIDVKALWGDTSDNIPGVPGIGEKGAFGIISQFGSLEEAYAHLDEVTPKRAQTNLGEFIEQARLSKDLATIRVDTDVSFDREAAKYENIYTKEAYELCSELGLKAFLKRFPKDLEAEASLESVPQVNVLGVSLKVDETFENMDLNKSLLALCIAKDGSGIAVSNGECAQFIESGDIAGIIDVLLSRTGAVFAVNDLKEILKYLPVDKEPDLGRFFDIPLVKYLIDPTRSSYEFEAQTTELIAAECFAEYESLVATLENEKMWELYTEIERPLTFVLSKMEREGIYLDTKELSEYNRELTENIIKYENEIYTECGEIFNINSPKQLGEILFGKMGLPGGKKTKTGYSTAADVLEKLAGEYPIVNKILLYRQYAKLKSTYAEGLMDCVAEDGRIHTSFQQTVTATGRLSSTNPNLQNIPIRTELGRLIRKVFLPKPGYVFVDADYSQIELRVLAHMSGDENLIEAYRENKDIHRSTAAKVFGKPFEEVTDRERSNAKAVNFGIVYGISSFGLGQDLNISRAEAQQYIDDYYKAYPSLKLFLDSLIERAKRLGYTLTMYGRRRPVPELKAKNFMQRSFGERISMNTPIQGSAADIIKIAMIRVEKRLREEGLESKLILQVHDELLIEAKCEEQEKVCVILKEEMEKAASLRVPLVADVHSGASWYEAK